MCSLISLGEFSPKPYNIELIGLKDIELAYGTIVADN